MLFHAFDQSNMFFLWKTKKHYPIGQVNLSNQLNVTTNDILF